MNPVALNTSNFSSPMKIGMAYTQRQAVCLLKPHEVLQTSAENWICTAGMGVSRHAWAQFNMGDHVQDMPDHVMRNRQQLQEAVGQPLEIVRQVHGTHVCVVQQVGDAQACTQGADALVTRTPGLALTMLVADCLPILLASPQHHVVAAAHAGWRGLSAGVIQATIQTMAHQANCGVQNMCSSLQVWLGPCIGPAAFEVGAEVLQAFERTQGAEAVALASQQVTDPQAQARGACARLNLPLLARMQLQNMGVAAVRVSGNDGSHPWCTYQNEIHYFSHRRSSVSGEGPCGRMAAAVWMQP